MRHYVVVGAGVAGLTIAHQLATKGHPVTVVERDAVVGGLARSWHYGDFHFDVGPHRFHTDNPRVEAFIRQILGNDVIEIPRRSGVRMFGRFHEWPLRPGILLSMPFSLMIGGAFDLLRRERLAGDSFEADIVNKYGRTLYSIFFEPYTRKFNFASPAELHQDWGRAGVNRAVIDKRASADSLWSLLKTTLLPKPVETTFLYPPTGVGVFSEKLAQGIAASGGRVVLGTPVTGIEAGAGRVTAVITAAERIACDGVVWTAPLTLAASLLGLRKPELDYLSTVFYNFEINAPDRIGFQWTYYGGDEVFSRVSCPVAFAPTMAPAGKSSLCVEVTCKEGDDTWNQPGSLTDRIVADLVGTGTVRRREDIGPLHIERMPQTYPIYTLPYLTELTRSLRELGQYSNLLMAGRTGRFWYNNMDHSIGQGLTMSDKILRGKALAEVDSADREFWQDSPALDSAAAGTPSSAPAPPPSGPPAQTPAPIGAGFADRRWAVRAAATAFAGLIAALAWTLGNGLGGLVYALLYLAALVPGLPVGFALFGRRQAAGWIAGGLIGYVTTAVALWVAIAAGVPHSAAMIASWAAVSATTWLPYLVLRPAPLVALPRWRRQDTLALLLVLLMVPALLAPTLSKVGALDDSGNERYRAYFTADFLWHASLTAELARFDMPPKDPYAGDHTLNYYWTYFLLPGSATGTDPFGLWPDAIPVLKVNRTISGLLFIGMLAVFTWSIVPRAGAMASAVALGLLASSAEGAYALVDALAKGKGFASLRELNVDAVTAWVFESLTVDGLQRSLWYTPQHAMACALGLVALTAATARKRETWPAALLAGVALGASVACSPFLGGMFSLIYAAGILVTARGPWRTTVRALLVHAAAAAPVLLATGWCQWNNMFDGAGAAVAFGYRGPITKAPVIMPVLTLGPIAAAAALGAWRGRGRDTASIAPVLAGVAIGFLLLYFVSMPGADVVWIGWRAGQILLLTMTPLAALAFASIADAGPRKTVGWMAAVALFVIGLPTTIIDTYNAQDIWNRRMGPGFRWTVVVTPYQRKAFDWIQRETPEDAIVQMEPTVRGREAWTNIPAFAERRMAAGLPISLLRKPVYTERSAKMRTMYGTEDPVHAHRLALEHGVDFIYTDATDRRAFGIGLHKFDNHPELFERVYRAGDASVYRVVARAIQ